MAIREARADEVVLSGERSYGTTIAALFTLTKPRIMALLLFTTLAALLVAARQHPLPMLTFWRILAATMVGGACASGGAAALNCYLDRDIDLVMARTRKRGLPAGTLSPKQVLYFGIGLTVFSVVVLLAGANLPAAALALGGNFFYVVIYTRLLKRSTTQNIVIGGIAGAIPPLVGWAAVTGSIGLPAILLLVIITYWTPAHFWSLALLLRGDYTRAQVPMLPSLSTQLHARWQIVAYTVMVVIASLLLFTTGTMGTLYLVAALLLGAAFLGFAVRLYVQGTARAARLTFLYSNCYLAALFGAMILDSLVR